MVRIIFIFAFFLSNALALSTLELARNLVANPAAEAKLKLLFEGKNYTDHLGYPRWDEISTVLKTNSLLNLTLNEPTSLELSFTSTNSQAVLFIKIINDSLSEAGFVHFIPTNFKFSKERNIYTVKVDSRYLLDPGLFRQILNKNLVYITNIKKKANFAYEYELDFGGANYNPPIFVGTKKTKLKRPHKDYMLSLQNARNIYIEADTNDKWFPRILFLDKNLNLVESIHSTEQKNNLSANIPKEAQYVLIGDNFNLDNIRRGLSVELR